MVYLRGLLASLAILLSSSIAVAQTFPGLITSDRILGRDSAGTGQVEQLEVGNGLDFSGTGSIIASETELEALLELDDINGDLTLAGDVDGAHGANDLDEANVEVELEGVLDVADLQGFSAVLTEAEAALAYQPLDSDLTSWAGVTRATGFDTFTATPSSANLDTLVTDDTGSGALVFGTAPDITISATTETNIEGAVDLADLGDDYVAAVADGTGVDGTASGVGSTYTPTLDLTELSTFTLGTGSATGIIFDAGATDPAIETASGSFTVDIGGTNELVLSATALTYGGSITATGDDLVSGDEVLVGDDINFTSVGGLIEWNNATDTTMTCSSGNCTIEGVTILLDATNTVDAANINFDYVGTVADGTGIDGTASGEGSTYTPTLDFSELTADTPVSADEFAFSDVSGGDHNKVTLTNLVTAIDGIGAFLSNVVEDTSPQLGGGLDLNTFGITDAADPAISLLLPGGQIFLVQVNANDAQGAQIDLWQNSTTPADGDIVGAIKVAGGADDEYVGQIRLELDDGSTGSEDTQWQHVIRTGGADLTALTLGGTATFTLAATDYNGIGINYAGTNGPWIYMANTDATQAAGGGGNMGIDFSGLDDADNSTSYASLSIFVDDDTNGSEDAHSTLTVYTGGSALTALTLGGTDAYASYSHVFDFGAAGNSSVELRTTDAGAIGPYVNLYQNSATPAANDIPGYISFTGESSTSAVVEYGHIETAIVDTTNGAEDSRMGLQVMSAGSLLAALTLGGYAADTGFDTLFGWDDSVGYNKAMLLADLTTEAAPAAGDYVLIYGAEGDVRKVNWSSLPGVGGGISNVVEDTTPQLGGDLDLLGQTLFDSATTIEGSFYAQENGFAIAGANDADGASLEIVTTGDGASGSILFLTHQSASAADGDLAGRIEVYGGADLEEIGSIALEVDDGGTGSEDTRWRHTIRVAGADLEALTLGGADWFGGTPSVLFESGSVQAKLTSDGNFGPYWTAFLDTTTPAALDTIGGFSFVSRDSGANALEYGSNATYIVDPTDGSEDSAQIFYVQSAGSPLLALTLGGTNLLSGLGSIFDVGASAFGGIQINSTNATAAGPALVFYHNTASSDADDYSLNIQLNGGADDERMSLISTRVIDGATTTEDIAHEFWGKIAGTETRMASVGNGVIIGTGTTFPGEGSLLLYNDNDSVNGPFLRFHHDDPSADADDFPGFIQFHAGADDERVSEIGAKLTDPATGTEDAFVYIATDIAGSESTRMSVGDGVIIGSGTTFPGAGELMVGNIEFHADATHDIGTSTVGINDLHFGSTGGVINFDGGDVTLTMGNNLLIMAGGNFVVGDATSASASVGSGGTVTTPGIQASDSGNGQFGAFRWSTNDSVMPRLFLNKSGNATPGSHTVVATGENLGEIVWAGSDGTDFEPGAAISAIVDASPGAGDMPTRLEFMTTADTAEAATTRLTIKNDGGVIIGDGTSSPGAGSLTTGDDILVNHPTDLNLAGVNSNLQVVSSSSDWSITAFRHVGGTSGAAIALGHSRNTTFGSHTVVNSGDDLGEIYAYGSDGDSWEQSSSIRFQVDAAPGNGDMPGRIAFATSADGAAAPTERLRITSTGRMIHTLGQVAHYWVYWTANSTTILASHNVTGIDDDAAGDAGINITTAFSSNNYAAFVDTNDTTNGWDNEEVQSSGINVHTTATVDVLCSTITDGTTAATNLTDPDQWQSVGFGVSG